MSIKTRRSMYKPVFVDYKLLQKVQDIIEKGAKKYIKTYSRASTILPIFEGFVIAIHDGKKFVDLFVTQEMIGLKLGEFAQTRKFGGHAKKAAKAIANKGKKK